MCIAFRAKWLNGSRRLLGFTLIELLAVIAVIAILFAILIPTVASIRSSAQKSECANNLRNIGMAYSLYAQDHQGEIVPFRETVGDDGGGIIYNWNETLRPFINSSDDVAKQTLSNSSGVYHCPKFLNEGHRRVASGYATSYVINLHALSRDEFSLRLNQIAEPARTLLLADGLPHDEGGRSSLRNFSHTRPGAGGRINYELHGGRANFLFVDGHVESIEADPSGPPIHRDGNHLLDSQHPF